MANDIQNILPELNIEVRTDRLVNRQVYHKLSSLWDISSPAASPSNPIPAPLPMTPSLFLLSMIKLRSVTTNWKVYFLI